MSKKSQRRKSTKFAVFGIILSITFFILSIFFSFNSIQGEWLWIIVLILALSVGFATSFTLPSVNRNGRYFVVASGIFALLLLIVFDMQDEAINTYQGGFDTGNDFLLDGLAQLVYIGAVPVLFLVYIALLVINIKRKSNAIGS